MMIPVPLCGSQMWNGFGGIMLSFIRIGDYVDVESHFHANGRRVGSQTGHYGAYIDAGNIKNLRFDHGEFRMADGQTIRRVNAPAPQGFEEEIWTRTYQEWGSTRGHTIACAWQDDQYQYIAHCTLNVVYTAIIVGDQITVVYKPSDYVSCEVYRATHQSIQGIQPGSETCYVTYNRAMGLWPSGSTTSMVRVPRTDSWPGSGQRTGTVDTVARTGVSLADLGDPETAYNLGMFYCQIAASMCDRQESGSYWNSSYTQWCYTLNPTGDSVDYQKLFNQLLHTYEFSDPELAKGECAKEAHYEIRETKDAWGKTQSRNVWIPRGGPYGTYVYEWLTQHAWMDACQAIPKANDNSIQNVLALAELLIAIKNLDVAEIPDILWDRWKSMTKNAGAAADAISDMWMRYRYEYSTTKMDIDEYVKYGLEKLDSYMLGITKSRCHGHATYGDYECNCSMTWSERGLTGLNKFCHGLWESGLEPNAYLLWDFVPFSFVADWFAPVGDVLQTFSNMQYTNANYYDFSDIVFSIRYSTGPISGYSAQHFVRWVATTPPVVDESYWFDDGDSSTGLSTKFKRVCDSGCLLYGIAGHR